MPRYYFHLQGSTARDFEGEELADDGAAIHESQLVARDFSRNRSPALHERIVVTNERGATVHEEPVCGV